MDGVSFMSEAEMVETRVERLIEKKFWPYKRATLILVSGYFEGQLSIKRKGIKSRA